MVRVLALLLSSLISSAALAALAAPGVTPGGVSEFNIELPTVLRNMAGRGKVSPVSHALITIAAPAKLDMAHDWPVLVISATSDPQANSSRKLLRAYAQIAMDSGWIVIAADPAEAVTFEQDDVPMRLALNTAALAVLAKEWPGATKAPLAFGGFSGGAKTSGWLAAAFASQGRAVIGIYLAGINQETLVPAATQFGVLNTAFKRIPVFLQVGEKDDVATPADHQDVVSDLRRAGFKNVRLTSFPGSHEPEAGPLKTALAWFSEFAASSTNAK